MLWSMASWKDMASAEPDFATLVQRYFAAQKHAAMATRRRDRRIGSKKRPARRANASRLLGHGDPSAIQ